jgi:hypothetical protein
MIDDLKHYRAERDAFQLIDEGLAGLAFCIFIFLALMALLVYR